jgi:hypothetical protein
MAAAWRMVGSAMPFFDFAESVRRAQNEAPDKATLLSAKTTVHSAAFPGAVRRAVFRLLGEEGFAPGAHDLVIGAAPWSDFDLEVLERLVSAVRGRTVRVIVFDMMGSHMQRWSVCFPG